MDYLYLTLTLALLASLGAVFHLARRGGAGRQETSDSQTLAAKIVANAEREAEMLRRTVELEIKDQRLTARAEAEQFTRDKQQQILDLERNLLAQEERMGERARTLDTRDAALREQGERLARNEAELAEQCKKITGELERASGLTADLAKQELTARIERETRFEAAKLSQRIEDEARREAEERAKHIIASAIQRVAGDYVAESAISVVAIPSDDMKGRIIGREGRNIRALESATGVNLIIDDTPETILLSSFDPFRREVARLTIEKLMADGRFHPTRIEETAAQVESRLDQEARAEATRILYELQVQGVHDDITGLLGRLKYRLSYGQNNLAHAREVALICGMMADEMGLNRALAIRGGLMHDIGKALTQDVEGGHATIGAEFARKCGESAELVNAIAAHHGDVPPITREAYLVAAGDALSAGRPGARRENVELYCKRLANLEQAASAFSGVEKVYALQAGREIRVLVDANALSDDACAAVSRDIAHKIQQELSYPGQVKICVVRESRFIEYAR